LPRPLVFLIVRIGFENRLGDLQGKNDSEVYGSDRHRLGAPLTLA
jgi:hypothetical protein